MSHKMKREASEASSGQQSKQQNKAKRPHRTRMGWPINQSRPSAFLNSTHYSSSHPTFSPTSPDMSLDSYPLSDFPGQKYKLDLGHTHQTLLLTIQTRLVQTRWQLNEEREERMRLEHRLMHSDPPPSATSEDMSVSPSSDSTLMDFEEDPLWEKDGDFSSANGDTRLEALEHENEKLTTEVQELRQLLSAERASREALERGMHSMRRSWENERHLRVQAEKSLRGISPTSVPYIMEAFDLLAQLTDKVMVAGGQ